VKAALQQGVRTGPRLIDIRVADGFGN